MSVDDTGARSAAEIEREVEQSRDRLTDTVQELKDRVSPTQMAEQAMDWVRNSGGQQFLGNLGTAIRDNPVPVMLIAAGVGWLALSGRNGGGVRQERDEGGAWPVGTPAGENYADAYAGESYPPETYTGVGEARQGTRGRSLGEHAGAAAAWAGEAGGEVRHRAEDLANQAGEAAGGLRDKAGNLIDRAGEAASGIRDKAGELAGHRGRGSQPGVE